MPDDTIPPNICRHPGCASPRTSLSVFCANHHAQQLDRAGSGAELSQGDTVRLIMGPWWLNLLLILASATLAVFFEPSSAFIAAFLLSLISAAVAWLKSHRLVWKPDLGFPIAHIPSTRFLLPIALYSI